MIFIKLFLAFSKVGLFTLGGGYAMVPLIQKEIVERHSWLTMEQFTDIIAIAEMTPGPIAVNTATFVGYKLAKLAGAIVSTLGVVLPSFLVIWAVAKVFISFQDNPFVEAAFKGLRPAVLGMIIVAALSIANIALSGFKSVIIAAGVVLGVFYFKVHPAIAFIIAGIIGILFFR